MRFSDLLGMYLSVCSGRGTIPGFSLGVFCVAWADMFRRDEQ